MQWRTGAFAMLRWTLIAALTTTALVALRGTLEKAHVALAYLLVVLVGSARVGRRAGVTLAILCFVCFNFFLLPPYHTLRVADPLDWLVLLAFLITSVVAAELLYRAQHQAALARERTDEVNRLAMLGAETLSVGRAEEATEAIARVLQSALGVDVCEVYETNEAGNTFRLLGRAAARRGTLQDEARTSDMFGYAITKNAVVVQRVEGTIHVLAGADGSLDESVYLQPDARVIVLPLRVRGRPVGILRLSHDAAIQLSAPQGRFANALAYYAALGVERVRLSAEAERAQALAAADQLKDAFIAAVSHDLRTPLTTIKGLAHELSAGDDRAETIELEADRLNRLVADVLDLSRLKAGGLHPQPDVNTADDLVGAALAQLAGVPRAKDVVVRLPDGVLTGQFDFVHSLRALVNLAENAMKYSPADSPIEIEARHEQNQLIFSVTDRGPGLPESEIAHLFEPFVRGSHASRAASGAGLGLAIAHGLADAQGGAVRYAPRPGGGSVFSLHLPAAYIPATTGS